MTSKFDKADFKSLSIGQKLKLGNDMYRVYKLISYKTKDDDEYEFIEYELIPDDENLSNFWLSVGITDDYVELFQDVENTKEGNLKVEGYRLTEDILAKVFTTADLTWNVNNDIVLGEEVEFREYKKNNNVISVEAWEDDDGDKTEKYYSKKVDMVDIEVFEYEGSSLEKANYKNLKNTNKGVGIGCVSTIILAIVAFIGFVILPLFSKDHIKDYLKGDKDYTYYTSLTATVDTKLKADLYLTNLSVDEAASDILSEVGKKIERSQGSNGSLFDVFTEKEPAVAMLTDEEYAIVYEGLDDLTYIQVSPREYNYVSNSDLFEYANEDDNEYYHDFYYTYAHEEDEDKFDNRVSAHSSSSSSSVVVANTSNKHYRDNSKSSSSAKRGSTSTRSSSSGGISSGK